MPRRDLTAKYRQQYYYLFHQPVTMMKTMFGCPYKCSFCYHWPLTGGKVYLRSPESIVDELEQIESKDIYIIDDTFFVHVARLKRIRDLIIERKIEKEYIIYSRSDFIVDHPDIVRDWADIGLKTAIVGLESIHDNDLQRFNKKASARQNVEAIKIMQTHRVDIVGSFIVGMDWTRQDFAQLENYIERTKLYYFMIQPFTPYPGTAIFDQYEDEIIVDRKDHDVWDLQHAILPTHLPKREFYRRIRQIYIRKALNPLRARKLRLRPVPPLWSKKFLRLIWGTIKVYFDWLGAHKHADILARKRLALLPPASKNSTQRIFSRSR